MSFLNKYIGNSAKLDFVNISFIEKEEKINY